MHRLEVYLGGRANWSTQAPSLPPEMLGSHLTASPPTHLLAHKEAGSDSQPMSEVIYGVGQQVEIATDLREGRGSQTDPGGQGSAGPATWEGAAVAGGGPEGATHFDGPDHGTHAGLCSRLGQRVASTECGGSSGIFAGGLGPGEGGRGDIRCSPIRPG